jgi:hypothetical protein
VAWAESDPGAGADRTSAPSGPIASGSGGRMTTWPFGPCRRFRMPGARIHSSCAVVVAPTLDRRSPKRKGTSRLGAQVVPGDAFPAPLSVSMYAVHGRGLAASHRARMASSSKTERTSPPLTAVSRRPRSARACAMNRRSSSLAASESRVTSSSVRRPSENTTTTRGRPSSANASCHCSPDRCGKKVAAESKLCPSSSGFMTTRLSLRSDTRSPGSRHP